ncbi:MAG: P-II family nitrogen regulator [Candidatus Korobacteraceae bacterium]
MTKVEAIIRPWKFEEVKEALVQAGVEGITVSEVVRYGRNEEYITTFRGQSFRQELQSGIKLELVLLDDMVEAVVEAITTAARTGEIGDGAIFLSAISHAVRIRNGNQGVAAL